MDSDKGQWPFDAPKNAACFTSSQVFAGDPICFVYHDWEDGAWQFLPNREIRNEDVMLVCLEEVWKHDPSVGVLADLQEGWKATRQKSGSWSRERFHPYPTFSEDGYYLIPVASFPEHYTSAPPKALRSSLKPGDIVKLAFRFASESAPPLDYDIERMWVIVDTVDSDAGTYGGVLDNDPKFGRAISSGESVIFNQLHVLAIDDSQ